MNKAIVFHTRPYRNTSLLVDFFVDNEGLLRMVAKGSRGKSNNVTLNLFQEYLIEFKGKGELKTLTKYEQSGKSFSLIKESSYCGLYLNELLNRVLYPGDPHPRLYDSYREALYALGKVGSNEDKGLERVLRLFELDLLEEIGYLVDLRHDYTDAKEIESAQDYLFDQEKGFTKPNYGIDAEMSIGKSFSGKSIIDMANRNFDSIKSLSDAKKINRMMLANQIGDKPLNSYKLFQTITSK